MDIIKYDVYRGPNLGVYISTNDSVVLLPMGFAESKAEKLAEYLDVDYHYTAIANSITIPPNQDNYDVILSSIIFLQFHVMQITQNVVLLVVVADNYYKVGI